MESFPKYEDSGGLTFTAAELSIPANVGKDGVAYSIPVEDIRSGTAHDGLDWKPGLGFAAAGVVLLWLPSGTVGLLFGLASLIWSGFIFFHPSQRLHWLFLQTESGSGVPLYPIRSYGGRNGKECMERLAEAIKVAKAREHEQAASQGSQENQSGMPAADGVSDVL